MASPHPLGLEPSGNILFRSDKVANLRDTASLGVFATLPDEVLLHIISALGPEERGRAACASRGLYLLCNLDEFWKAHVLEDIPNHWQYEDGWRATWLKHMRPNHPRQLRVPRLKVKNFFSDLFYQPFHCATAPILPEWLQTDTIERVDDISFDEFRQRFELPNRPVIVRGVVDKWPAFKKWNKEYLSKHFGDLDVIAGGHKLTFREYMDYCERQQDEMPLYLFDKFFAQHAPQLARDYSVPALFPEDLFAVLGDRRPDYRWLILGPERSGSSFHVDPNSTSAWNAVIYGRKKWIMFPPNVIPPGVVSSTDGATVATSVSLYEWLENNYAALEDMEVRAVEGVCEAGELVFVPRGWWHWVLNLEESLALTQNFVSSANLPHVLRFLRQGNEELISGLPVEERSELYDRFVSALEEQQPAALEKAREAEAARQRRIEESHKLALLFSGGEGAGTSSKGEGATTEEPSREPAAQPATAGGFTFAFKF